MVLDREFELVVGKFETHRISFINEITSGTTVIKVDGSEIFRSRSMKTNSNGSRNGKENKIDQWFYSFTVGTQETHIIEVHVKRKGSIRRTNSIRYEYNIMVDGVLRVREGKKMDPHKSGTKTDVVLEIMSRDHFHILSDVEKKLYSRDILKNPDWKMEWVYVQ
jgi:hypothetical protein